MNMMNHLRCNAIIICWYFVHVSQSFVHYSPRQLPRRFKSVPNAVTQNNMPYPTKDELEKVLNVAMEAAEKAGDIIRNNAEGSEVIEKKASSRDLLTRIDPQCERVGSFNIYIYI